MKHLLKYLSAKHFFADYAPGVKNFAQKMRGTDGNGNAIEFSSDDRKAMAAGVKQMVRDVVRELR